MTKKTCPECHHITNDPIGVCPFCRGDVLLVPYQQPKAQTNLTKPKIDFNINLPKFRFKSPLIIGILVLGTVAGGATMLKGTAKSSQSSSETYTPDIKNVRVQGDTFSGYSTFRTMGVRYSNEFDQSARAKALGTTADIIITSLDQFLKNRPDGDIVGLIDHTTGADAVLYNTHVFPSIRNMDDLDKEVRLASRQGKQYSIVYSKDTPSEYLLSLLSQAFEQFSLEYFNLIEVEDASQAYKALKDPKNGIALAVLWEPFVSQAEAEGYKVALTSADVPETIIDVIVASEKFQKNPKKLSYFLSQYYAKVGAWRLNRAGLKNQIIADSNPRINHFQALRVIEGIHFFSPTETKKWFTEGRMDNRINATWGTLASVGPVPDLSKEKLYTAAFLGPAVERSARIDGLLQLSKAKVEQNQPKTKTQPRTTVIAELSENIVFDLSGVALDDEDIETLKKLMEKSTVFGGQTAIELTGHSSAIGGEERNKELSQRRVFAVAKWLKSAGFKGKVLTKYAGSQQPLEGVSPEDGSNQRVEAKLVRETS